MNKNNVNIGKLEDTLIHSILLDFVLDSAVVASATTFLAESLSAQIKRTNQQN